MRPIFTRTSGEPPIQLDAGDQVAAVGERKTTLTLEVEAPTPSLKDSLPQKKGWNVLAHLPHLIGRVGVGIAVTAVLMGTLVGDTPAARRQVEPTPIVMTAPVERGPSQVAKGFAALHEAMALVMPDSLDNQTALSAMQHISVSMRLDRGQFIGGSGTEGLEIPAGTRLTAYLTPSGVTFSASPSLTYRVDWMPDADIQQLTFNFRTAEFTAEASGLGPDSWYQSTVVDVANASLKSRLPEAMRQPGYNPFSDPNLERNIQSMIDGFAHNQDPATRAPQSADFTRLSGLQISFGFRVPSDLDGAIPSSNYHAWLKAGTRVDVSLGTGGSVTNMALDQLQIGFSQPILIGQGHGPPGAFKRMELNGINLAKNGQVTLDYELGPEQAIDGFKALFTLFAIAADPRSAGNLGSIERTRLERVRGDIQGTVDTTIEPLLHRVIRENDGKISGLSLVRFFGLEPVVAATP